MHDNEEIFNFQKFNKLQFMEITAADAFDMDIWVGLPQQNIK